MALDVHDAPTRSFPLPHDRWVEADGAVAHRVIDDTRTAICGSGPAITRASPTVPLCPDCFG